MRNSNASPLGIMQHAPSDQLIVPMFAEFEDTFRHCGLRRADARI